MWLSICSRYLLSAPPPCFICYELSLTWSSLLLSFQIVIEPLGSEETRQQEGEGWRLKNNEAETINLRTCFPAAPAFLKLAASVGREYSRGLKTKCIPELWDMSRPCGLQAWSLSLFLWYEETHWTGTRWQSFTGTHFFLNWCPLPLYLALSIKGLVCLRGLNI